MLLDQSGAFDATSRKFTDKVLRDAGAGAHIRLLYRAAMQAATGKVRMTKADGSYAVSQAFGLDRGGVQGGMSTPWTYILGSAKTMSEDDSRAHDLDQAIRRECLRLEVCRREGRPMELAENAANGAAVADAGQQRWDDAVQRGGRALLAARDEARKELDERNKIIADRSNHTSVFIAKVPITRKK